MGGARGRRWQFWIDRGGTFTDCIGIDPRTGQVHTAKVLSSDRAPLVGIRHILGLGSDARIPACDVRMGTTLATNALLERRGARVALLITTGFADLLEISDQTRAELFDLDIVKPAPLAEAIVEVGARVSTAGHIEQQVDSVRLAATLAALRSRGIDSAAISILGAHRDSNPELEIAALARAAGFGYVACGSRLTASEGFLARTDTAVVDAYLTPLLRDYIAGLRAALPGSTLRVMQSSGGLTDADLFRGKDAVLSGPAGGVVACAEVARAAGTPRAIGFDMGGTSTDVTCSDGAPERSFETEVAGIRLRTPMLAIRTVAAGGGSLCRYRGHRLTVGPESAGADPGPAGYGRGGDEPTLTDVNLVLGRLAGDRFPFPLSRDRAAAALERLRAEIPEAERPALEELAAGLLEIANANMAEAIRRVTVARGKDVREFGLVVYGGAGGQHACGVARLLGVRTLIVDSFAGVLSAYGMGLADVVWSGDADGGRVALAEAAGVALDVALAELAERGRAALADQGFAPDQIAIERLVELRYRGSDTAIAIGAGEHSSAADLAADFGAAHRRRFGYRRDDALIEVSAYRVEARGRLERPRLAPARALSAPEPLRSADMWTGRRIERVPVFAREALGCGVAIDGPALILEATATVAIDPSFAVTVDDGNRLVLTDRRPDGAGARRADHRRPDPVSLEIFGSLFMSIAEQMGAALRRTAVSTNIRERRDFSCAVFDAGGGLVANAPHIPVHLGAMSETVRALRAEVSVLEPGTAYATNDPARGGSHLPDVTVITPVFDAGGELLFFTASRGHHADVGGSTPGSMPATSTRLDDEGAVLRMLRVVAGDRFDEGAVRAALAAGPYPARDPDSNVADLTAQIAANQTGADLLARALAEHGRDRVIAYMGHVQANAARRVADAIAALPDGVRELTDELDDGTVIAVRIEVNGRRLVVDFGGSGPEHPGNLNAPRAVTVAAVLYVLRCMVGAPIPLNSGCLEPIDLLIPSPSVLSPSPGRAVAGGNVETSQRIVDVLLGALGLAAASQGTMNNLTFGTADFGYYETIAGGAGATAKAPGAPAVHTHMTNTRITDPEVLESRFPARLIRFAVRRGSGGEGRHPGGDGVVRELEAQAPMQVSIVSERRSRAPFGLEGGGPGERGRNTLNGRDVGGRAVFAVEPGDRILIETPGGGGFGDPG